MQIPTKRIISNTAFHDLILDIILKEDEWLNEAQAERKWEIFVKRADVHEKRMRIWMVDVFRRQQADTLANMAATPNRGLRGWLTANKPINAGVIAKDIIDAWVFPLDEWVERMQTVSGVYLTDAMVETGQAELIDLVSDATFNVADPRAQAFINNRTFKFSTDVNVATQDALRASLSEGLATGEGMPALRNRVIDVFTNGYGALDLRASKVRADMIARSEIIRASNAGAELAYMQSGVVEAKMWYSALTDRTCIFCLDMHKKPMGLGIPFFEQGDTMTVDGKTIKLDYEEVRYPPLHPRCYDFETLVRTSRGWLPIKDVIVGDGATTINPATQKFEWGTVINTVKYLQDEMVHITSKDGAFDMMVTPNHTFFGYTQSLIGKLKPVFIDGIDNLPRGFLFSHAGSFTRFKKLQVERIQYNDMVYDVEVDRNHTIFTVRNNCFIVGSNCRCTLLPVVIDVPR